jgi:hypothetical protein
VDGSFVCGSPVKLTYIQAVTSGDKKKTPKGRTFEDVQSPASVLYWPAEDLATRIWPGFHKEITASTILVRFIIAIINLYLSDAIKYSQRLTRIAEYALS